MAPEGSYAACCIQEITQMLNGRRTVACHSSLTIIEWTGAMLYNVALDVVNLLLFHISTVTYFVGAGCHGYH